MLSSSVLSMYATSASRSTEEPVPNALASNIPASLAPLRCALTPWLGLPRRCSGAALAGLEQRNLAQEQESKAGEPIWNPPACPIHYL